MSETKKITRSEFTSLVNQGLKKAQIAEFFGIPKSKVAEILKTWGLRIKATRSAGVLLIDDTVDTNESIPELAMNESIPELAMSEDTCVAEPEEVSSEDSPIITNVSYID